MAETETHSAPATAEHTEAAHHAPPPAALGMDATGWVALAMLAVIGIMLWKKVPAVIAGALDKKIAGIKAQLDEAASLRAEAEALKSEYQAKAAAAAKDAEAILAHARDEADQIVAKAKTDATSLIERRGRMAEDKIAAAERTAIAEVRAKAADAAATAAASLIAKGHDATADKALVDRAISGLGTSARLN
jgi:F-type H+-transporting ATPase subunit b